MLIDNEIGIVGTYYVGDFDINKKYEYLNQVAFEGSTYTCICEDGAKGKEPTDTEFWTLSAKKGDKGDTGEIGPQGIQGIQGEKGNDATINGVNTLEITQGKNINLKQNGNKLEIENIYDDTDIKAQLKQILDTYITKNETNTAIADKIAEITADAPESFDTLKEISDWINTHEDSASSMNSAIQKNKEDIENLEKDKANKTDLDDYVKNTDYATSDKGGTFKTGNSIAIDGAGRIFATTLTTEQYNSRSNSAIIGKGTLENVLADKIGSVDALLDKLNRMEV